MTIKEIKKEFHLLMDAHPKLFGDVDREFLFNHVIQSHGKRKIKPRKSLILRPA